MYDGMINIYKEKGYTSHDVVAKLRGILRQKRIGHTGTLDPDAEGVLPVCLGKGTKLCDLLTDKDKVYEAELTLGITTDTQDISGQVLSECSVDVSGEAVNGVISGFIGDYMQVPPMYSAKKVNGQKLYQLAREGKTIERQASLVHIFDIEVLHMELPKVVMRVHCSKGTYIRTLCEDIGRKLGCGGCMSSLKRTAVGIFDCTAAHTLDEVRQFAAEDTVAQILMTIPEMLSDYRTLTVKTEAVKYLYNGNLLTPDQLCGVENAADGEWFGIYDDQAQFIAVYVYQKELHIFKNIKMFV